VISVRPATPTDVPAVRAVARPAWHATYDDALGRATVDGFVDAWYDPDALRRDVADDGPFVVAERDRSVVGFAQATGGARAVSEAGRRGPSEASLARLYVHPDDWGTGVGTALLGATARRLGPATRLRAVVMASNAVGRGFYERHGFRVRERRETTLRGVSFEVVVLVSPLAPLRGLSPAVDDERTERDGWDGVDAGDGSDDGDGRDGAGEAAGRQG
jgi:ribosomal protein S18 acetylase RimI-like enzyme